MLFVRSDSTEYITATLITDHDLTGKNIDVSIPLTGEDPDESPADWIDAELISSVQTSANRWTTTYRVLVGPVNGVVTLPAGIYDWTVRLTDSPEVPIRVAGQVKVE